MDFKYTDKRKWESASQRSVFMGQQGMVASSQYLATMSGYKALARGGNAVDAAVAMISTQSVVEPHSVGIGGDAFALIYLAKENKIIGLNASGRSPHAANLDWFRDRGISTIPERGILSVTVPGAFRDGHKLFNDMGNCLWQMALKMQSTTQKAGSPLRRL